MFKFSRNYLFSFHKRTLRVLFSYRSPNISVQQSPLNTNPGSFSLNSQTPSSLSMNNSTPLTNNYSSPINRSVPVAGKSVIFLLTVIRKKLFNIVGSGSISSPDEDTINLIKYFKDNVTKLQSLCQKFASDGIFQITEQILHIISFSFLYIGNQERARSVQVIHQQMLQFINNPTYESLPHAKHIREMLERASVSNFHLASLENDRVS